MKRDNLTIVLTPHLLERLQAAGLDLGAGNVAVWLTERAETLAALLVPVEDVDIEEVLRLDREATPGPWTPQTQCYWWGLVPCGPPYKGSPTDERVIKGAAMDARLIATYRSATPTLAHVLIQARARLAEVKQALGFAATDGATCSCVGWAPKVDDVEVQNAVAREIAHALGDEVPPAERLAVTPALGLQLVQVHTLRERWAAMQGRESSTAQVPSLAERLVAAGADAPGPRPAGCDCANPPPYPGATGAWGVSVACPVHGDGEDEIEEPVGGMATHPADCQTCSEGSDPCATHAQDWRYWQGRCLDAESGHKDALEELSAIGALLGWASGKTQERPKVYTRVERLLAQIIDERNDLAAKLAALLAQVESDDLIANLPAITIDRAIPVHMDAFRLLEHVAKLEPDLDEHIGRIHQLALDAPRMARAVIATRAQLFEANQALARAQGTVEHLQGREAAFLAALKAAGYTPADGGQYRADCASAVARMAEDLAALKRARGAVEHLPGRVAAFLAALKAAGYASTDGGQYRAHCEFAAERMAEDLAALKQARVGNVELDRCRTNEGAPGTMLSNPDVQVWWEPERNVR